MKKLIVLAAMIASTVAKADGFVCQTEEGDLNIKIYNSVDPQEGTRNVAKMVVSDPAVGFGRKTIATFSADQGTLAGGLPAYAAKVDLRFASSRAKGENIGGTKLGEVANIFVTIDHTYGSTPLQHGEEVEGQLVLQKRNGEELVSSLSCTRYLKN